MGHHNSRLWLGLIFIIIGALLLIDNLGFFYFDFRHLIFSWHTIFIIIGIILLTKSRNSTPGMIFLVIGLYGLLNHIFKPFFHFTFRDIFPLIIIIIGFYFILRRNESKHIHQKKFNEHDLASERFQKINSEYIDETCILTQCDKKIETKNFKGGRLTIIASSVNINLADSNLSSGEIILDVTCLFGGFSILIPKNWKVITNVTTIFGGLDTKQYLFDNSLQHEEGLLIIKGTIFFGGGEIKSA
ncbi:MAG: DUF5668 domain-containing protein [Melioribacteraceae bacterium]